MTYFQLARPLHHPLQELGADLLNVSAESVTLTLNTTLSDYNAALTLNGVAQNLVVSPGTLAVTVHGFSTEVKTFVNLTGNSTTLFQCNLPDSTDFTLVASNRVIAYLLLRGLSIQNGATYL